MSIVLSEISYPLKINTRLDAVKKPNKYSISIYQAPSFSQIKEGKAK